MAKLSKSQQRILETAAGREDGSIFPLPTKMPPVAQQMVMEALVRKGLIDDGEAPCITNAGRQAIGQEPPPEPEEEDPFDYGAQKEPAPDAVMPSAKPKHPICDLLDNIAKEHLTIEELTPYDPKWPDLQDSSNWGIINALQAAYNAGNNAAKKARKTGPRKNTKQARMIALMKRPEGATIEQISAEVGWNANTIRGVISGALRKRLGLDVTSVRTREGSSSVSTYFIEEEEKAAEPAEA